MAACVLLHEAYFLRNGCIQGTSNLSEEMQTISPGVCRTGHHFSASCLGSMCNSASLPSPVASTSQGRSDCGFNKPCPLPDSALPLCPLLPCPFPPEPKTREGPPSKYSLCLAGSGGERFLFAGASDGVRGAQLLHEEGLPAGQWAWWCLSCCFSNCEMTA